MIARDLHDIIRYAPPVAPGDSAARAIRQLRSRGLPALPVADGSRLVGLVLESDLLALAAGAPDPRRLLRSGAVSQFMRPLPLLVSDHQSLAEIAVLFRDTSAPAVPVSAPDGRYLGLLLPRDLLAAMAGEPVVPPIAGLATPLGVYLTTGALRAGAGDLGLVATGAFLMLLNIVSEGFVRGLAWLGGLAWPFHLAADRIGLPPFAVALGLYLLQILIFLLLLRLSPLTGIHASEHMVVRAIEEGEDLALPKVRTMPRVHPRCGTNLMALVILLVISNEFLSSVNGAVDEGLSTLALLALVVIVLLTWRRLGAGIQRWVTTKRPADRQLENAIAVGEELLQKVQARPSAVVPIYRRIWHMGFAQVLIGFFVVFAVVQYALPLLLQAWHSLKG
jgi:CBS domain-containing protein